MNTLHKKAFGGLAALVIVMAVCLFLPAWDVFYWQAWVFLATFSGCVLAITLYLMKKDPALLQRRVDAGPAAEKLKTQQIIQSLASVAFIAVLVVPAVDHHFNWSFVPGYLVVAGDVVVVLGLLVVFLVFKENSYTAAAVEVFEGQKIISTGPYAFVRHPMYSGALAMLAGIPLALGSWWGLLTLIPFIFVLVYRLLDEEKFLSKNLPGYTAYQQKVVYRLVPFVW